MTKKRRPSKKVPGGGSRIVNKKKQKSALIAGANRTRMAKHRAARNKARSEGLKDLGL